MILRTFCDRTLELGKSITLTFIDYYTTAFDSVSHRFIDVTIREAGVSIKVRAKHKTQNGKQKRKQNAKQLQSSKKYIYYSP